MNADHAEGCATLSGEKQQEKKKCSPCLVILDAFLLKGSFDGDEGVCLCGRERGELVVARGG